MTTALHDDLANPEPLASAIAVVLVSHSPYLCGAERMLINLAISLSTTRRYRPIVLIPNAKLGPLPKLLEPHGIEWHDTPPLHWFLWANINDTTDFLTKAAKGAAQYEDIFKRIGADLVVVNTLVYVESVIAAMRCDLPFVLWVHGILDAGMLGRADYLAEVTSGLPLKLSRHIVCCSHWTQRFFEHRVGKSKIETIHNWTEVPSAITPRAGKTRFAALSTLESHKGIDILIKAFAMLADRDVGLDLYGDGADKINLEHMVQRLGLCDRIKFHGRVVDVNQVYDASIATVFPSIVEPFGMVAIESMARGTPVIASRVGGLCEIIEDGVSGLLFEAGDINGLLGCMLRILDEPDLAVTIGRNGFERMSDRFDGSHALARFESVFDRVLNSFSTYNSEERDALDIFELGLQTERELQHADWSGAFSSSRLSIGNDRVITPPLTKAQQSGLTWSREAFEAPVHGHLDNLVDGRYLTGWADQKERDEPCLLEAHVDGIFAGRFVADLFREDLVNVGLVNAKRAFVYPVPTIYLDGQSHIFDVRLAATDLVLVGSPAAFPTIKLPKGLHASNFEEVLHGTEVKGWAAASVGLDHCYLDLFVDQGFCQRFKADLTRADLASAGVENGRGFRVALPNWFLDGNEHLIEIRFASTGIEIGGSPRLERTVRLANGHISGGSTPILANWARRMFAPHTLTVAVELKHGWRSGRNESRSPFVLAVADAHIPSTEILLVQPLTEMKRTYGVDFQIFIEGAGPDDDTIARADVILMLRLTSARSLDLVQRAKRHGTPMVYVIDDDLTLLGEEVGLVSNEVRRRHRDIQAMMRSARCVLVTNELLRARCLTVAPKVEIVHAAADVEFFDSLELDLGCACTDEIRIGYAGTQTHDDDVALIEDALAQVLMAHPNVVVESIGQQISSLKNHPRYRHFPEIEGVRSFGRFLYSRQWTIALAPLRATHFNEAKSDNKFRVYASARIAGIYSSLLPYEGVVPDKTGLLVKGESTRAWLKAIEQLLVDGSLRDRIVAGALAEVRNYHALPKVTRQMHDLLRSLVEVPTVMLLQNENVISSGLAALDTERRIFLRRSEYADLTQDELDWADLIIIAMSETDSYHPMLEQARASGCRIIAFFDASMRGNIVHTGQLTTQNFIIEQSDVLMVRNCVSMQKGGWAVLSGSTGYADPFDAASNWISRLEQLLKATPLNQEIVRRDFAPDIEGAGSLVWCHALRCAGIKLPPTALKSGAAI